MTATRRSHHDRMGRQIIHFINGLPGRFIGEGDCLRRLIDGSVKVDRLKQANALVAKEVDDPLVDREFGREFCLFESHVAARQFNPLKMRESSGNVLDPVANLTRVVSFTT